MAGIDGPASINVSADETVRLSAYNLTHHITRQCCSCRPRGVTIFVLMLFALVYNCHDINPLILSRLTEHFGKCQNHVNQFLCHRPTAIGSQFVQFWFYSAPILSSVVSVLRTCS